ncbi:hypothetical protein ACFLQR_04985, partial [Verrucomicrobiota bacterium]
MVFSGRCGKLQFMRCFGLIMVVVCAVCPGMFAAEERSDLDLGPIVSCDTDVYGNRRLRVLGPLFEKRIAPEGRELLAVRPFVCLREDAVHDRTDQEVLWPVWIRRRVEQEAKWTLASMMFWHDWNVGQAGSRYSFWVLPVYVQGRDKHGKRYLGVFPLAGRIREFLGQDELGWVLFPVAGYTRINQIRTRSFLWPFYSRSKGP